MPPSRIPEAQVQAILAELRESGVYPEAANTPTAVAMPRPARAKRGFGMTWAVIASALILGLAFSPLPDLIWSRPEAPAQTPAAPLAPPPAPAPAEPVVQPTPIANASPTVRRATVETSTSRTRPKARRCVSGAPCGRSDVTAAERRLRAAYNAADRAGVRNAELAQVKARWDSQRRRAARNPRTSVRAYRAMAAELNRKAAAARAND
jgi:hypothetical protein